MKTIIYAILTLLVFTSCTVIRPGEVGVRQTFGKLKGEPVEEGLRLVNPITTTYLKVPVRTTNVEQTLLLPSKEGLTINAEVSVLYHIKK